MLSPCLSEKKSQKEKRGDVFDSVEVLKNSCVCLMHEALSGEERSLAEKREEIITRQRNFAGWRVRHYAELYSKGVTIALKGFTGRGEGSFLFAASRMWDRKNTREKKRAKRHSSAEDLRDRRLEGAESLIVFVLFEKGTLERATVPMIAFSSILPGEKKLERRAEGKREGPREKGDVPH